MVTVFLSALSGVSVIIIMVVAGFVMNERGWFSPTSSKTISRIVTQISLPAYMINYQFCYRIYGIR